MKKNILLFGTISGVIVSVTMAISMYLIGCGSGDMESSTISMIIGFGSMIVAFSFIFIAIKNFRDKHNGGVITFGKAFYIGLIISLIASTLYVITWAIEFHFFMPDFIDNYFAMQISQLKESGISGPALDSAIQSINTENYNYKHNPFYFIMYTYMEILPVGILITLISSLILKKKETIAI